MKVLLLLLSLLSFGNTLHIDSNRYAEKCNIGGPQYWCRNKDTASRCQAVAYCQEHVWGVAKEGDDICAECQEYVGLLHGMLASNSTRQMIIDELTSACKQLPDAYQEMCQAMIENYVEKAIDMMEQYTTDAKAVCTSLGLCNGKKLSHKVMIHIRQSLKHLHKMKQVKTDYCTTCEQYVGTVHLILSNQETKTQVLNELTSLCNQYVKSSELCPLISTLGGSVYDELVAYLATPQKLCTTLGLCSGGKKIALLQLQQTKNIVQFSRMLPAVKSLNGELCDVCKFGVNYLDSMLKDNATEAELKQAVLGLCGDLPPSVSSICKSYVNSYWSAAIGLIVSELNDSAALCTTLHACTSVQKATPAKKVQANPVTCEVCEYAMNYLDSILADNATEKEIIDALDSLCAKLPSSISGECTSLINQYGDTILKLLISELKPDQICKELGLCSSVKKAINVPVKKVKANPVACEVCEYAMSYLDQTLSDHATEQEIINAVESLCSKLPSTISGECNTLVQQYGEAIIQMLIQQLKPEVICKELGLCSSLRKEMKIITPAKKFHANPVTCEVCEYAMNYLDSILTDKSTEQEIISALDSLCSKLPSSLSGECTTLINNYGEAILQMLVQEFKPDVICKELGLCTSKLVKKTKSNAVTCELCEYAMSYLDSILTDKSTEQEITSAVESLCSKLPASISGECKSLVDEYSETIIKMLIEDFQPAFVCQKLGLCTSTRKAKKPVVQSIKVKANPVTCEVCEYAMQYLDSMLSDNATETEIKQGLEQLCGYLPASVSGECSSLVDQYSDTLVKLLIQELNPETICKELQLCASNLIKAKKPVVQSLKVKANPVTCEVCEYAMQYLDSMLSDNATEAEIRQGLDQLCGYLPASVSGECTSLVNQYADTIIKLIVQELDPATICKELQLCAASKKVTNVKDDLTCTVCQDALEVLDNIIKENKTEEAIKNGLDKLCSLLPSSLSGECQSLVTLYGDAILNLLINEIDPSAICKELKLCASARKVVKTPIKNEVTCEFCKYAMTYLDNQLKSDRTEAKIKSALDSLCTHLPSSVSGECESLINSNLDFLVQLLVRELDPTTICDALKVCTTSPTKVSGEACTLCDFIVGQLVKDLKDNSTEDEILNALEGMCAKLPTHLNDECVIVVKRYFPQLVNLLRTEDAQTICHYLGFCSSSLKNHSLKKALLVKTNPVECEVCQSAIGYLDSVLTEQSTEDEIKTAVKSLCSHLPAAIDNECDALITEYGDELIKLVVQQIKPDTICKALKVC
ncbi:uncharacterized protein [Clytia hemisphaerica]|uniref:uncharacterized protein isoform X2 n=1 Tax=Clytia hemisphaerica TaxID=252671 RepID=UPI0034D53CD1